LYAKEEKCEFHSDSVEYLGYVLSPSGLTMSDTKVKIIQEWPELKKVKDIQSFLGFTNFYRRFIFNYSDIVIPLTHLTRKGTPWNFDNDCKIAFNNLKQAFTSTPIFTVTNFIWSYLHQIFDDSHGLKASLKPLRRPFDRCQSRLEAINIGQDIKQINW